MATLSAQTTDRSALEAERTKLDRELVNLAAAVAAGVDLPTLVAGIREREARKMDIDRELARPCVDRDGIRRALEAKIADWRSLLRGSATHGRTVISRLVEGGSIRIYRTDEGVSWGAVGDPAAVLRGLYKQLASPSGSVRRWNAKFNSFAA